jgi:ubiquinone/menaquinone biosynthesis C-methylase UbiE/rhodanese-related sulfurtransferase
VSRFRGSGPRAGLIEPTELASRLAVGWSPRLVDVRTSFERRLDRIPGSEHVALPVALARAKAWDEPTVVVCRSGHRAALVARRAGAPEVLVLAGGTQGWIRAGLPVDRGAFDPSSDDVDGRGGDGSNEDRSDPKGFDRMMGAIDIGGMRRWRREAAAALRGRALELGAGTGRNSAHVPPGVRLVAVEPDIEALRYRQAEGRDRGVAIVARGEELPFRDGSFDSGLSTLVLCSVEDQPRVAAELRRVLRPGAVLSAIDHVLAENRLVAKLQRRLAPAWYRRTESCRIDRQSLDVLRRAGFDVRVKGKRIGGAFVRYQAESPIQESRTSRSDD